MQRFFIPCVLILSFMISKGNAETLFNKDMYLNLSYATGQFIAIDEDYAQVELFVPIVHENCWLSLGDFSAYRFESGKWASSMGLALRKEMDNYTLVGVNVYYDYRRGRNSDANFHRFGFGIEWLNDCFDIRLNSYLPFNKKNSLYQSCKFSQLGDGFIARVRKSEFAYSGFDAEIGKYLLNYCDFNLYGALGPYYFQRKDRRHFWGCQGRVELDWQRWISLQVNMSYDHIYSFRIQGILEFSIPLNLFFTSSCHCECPSLIQPIHRNGILLIDDCCDWKWNW